MTNYAVTSEPTTANWQHCFRYQYKWPFLPFCMPSLLNNSGTVYMYLYSVSLQGGDFVWFIILFYTSVWMPIIYRYSIIRNFITDTLKFVECGGWIIGYCFIVKFKNETHSIRKLGTFDLLMRITWNDLSIRSLGNLLIILTHEPAQRRTSWTVT